MYRHDFSRSTISLIEASFARNRFRPFMHRLSDRFRAVFNRFLPF
jgi:hypothetical protein